MTLSLLALALPARAQTDNTTIPPDQQASCGTSCPPVDHPEEPLNCDVVWFPRANIHAIVQNHVPHEPNHSAAMRAFGKFLFRHAVLLSSGAVHDAFTSGVLAGMEFDWFFRNGQTAPTEDRLAVTGNMWGTDASGDPQLLARIYCYDAAQFSRRKAALEAQVGHPLRQFTVWADMVTTATSSTAKAWRLAGSSNQFYGACASAGGARIRGAGNELFNGLELVGEARVGSGNNLPVISQVAQVSVPALPFDAATARAAAQSAGTYYSGEARITSATPQGLIFAEGDVVVEGAQLSGLWTFVSGSGDVEFSGSGADISPSTGQVLAVSFAGEVEVSGSSNLLRGELHAPAGEIQIAGSSNQVRTLLLGQTIRITGSGNVISDGTDPVMGP